MGAAYQEIDLSLEGTLGISCGRDHSFVPLLHVIGVRSEIRSRFVEPVAEIHIKVVSLQVHDEEHGGHRYRELAECFVDVLNSGDITPFFTAIAFSGARGVPASGPGQSASRFF